MSSMKEMEKPIEPIHDESLRITRKAVESAQQQSMKTTVPKIIGLNEKQQQTAYIISKSMRDLPGIETRPQISKTLDDIVKAKGENIKAAKALVSEKEQIYSLEMTIRDKPVILTVSLDDATNSTTILLTDKSGKTMEGFYNQSKKA